MSDSKHEIDNPEVIKILNAIGKNIGEALPPNFGFTLLIFSYHPDNQLFYISSARRDDMVKAMREFIEKEQDN